MSNARVRTPAQLEEIRKLSAGVWASDGCLWGAHGGQLEYVGQRVEHKLINEKWHPYMVLLFTDHDCRACDDREVEPGVHYRFVFPVAVTAGATQ